MYNIKRNRKSVWNKVDCSENKNGQIKVVILAPFRWQALLTPLRGDQYLPLWGRIFISWNLSPKGSQLWSTEYGRKINSSYLLLEGWAKRWRRGETKRIRFSLGAVSTPVQVRAVVVRHRREYIAPTNYSTVDQQGYPVAALHW